MKCGCMHYKWDNQPIPQFFLIVPVTHFQDVNFMQTQMGIENTAQRSLEWEVQITLLAASKNISVYQSYAPWLHALGLNPNCALAKGSIQVKCF